MHEGIYVQPDPETTHHPMAKQTSLADDPTPYSSTESLEHVDYLPVISQNNSPQMKMDSSQMKMGKDMRATPRHSANKSKRPLSSSSSLSSIKSKLPLRSRTSLFGKRRQSQWEKPTTEEQPSPRRGSSFICKQLSVIIIIFFCMHMISFSPSYGDSLTDNTSRLKTTSCQRRRSRK